MFPFNNIECLRLLKCVFRGNKTKEKMLKKLDKLLAIAGKFSIYSGSSPFSNVARESVRPGQNNAMEHERLEISRYRLLLKID